MSDKTKAVLLFLLLFLAANTGMNAASAAGKIDLFPGVDNRGSLISDAPGQEIYPCISGGTLEPVIFWYSARTNPPSLIAQKISASGESLWTPNGVSVVQLNSPFSSLDPVCSLNDENGGAVLIWNLYSSEAGTGQLRAQRIDSSGNLLWSGAPLGATIIKGNYTFLGKPVLSAPDSMIILYTSGYGAGPGSNIKAQKVDLNTGTIEWPAGNPTWEGLDICTREGMQFTWGSAASDNSGGAIVAWRESSFPAGTYANRVDSNGNLLWAGQAGIRVFPNISGSMNIQKVIEDGSGGAIIAALMNGGVFAQRLDSSGNLMWGNGVTLSPITVISSQGAQYLDAQPDGLGGAIVSWGYRYGENPGLVFEQVFSQRLDHNGAKLWPAASPASDGMAVESPRKKMIGLTAGPRVCPDGRGGAVIVWSYSVTNAQSYIYAQRVDPAGNIKWPKIESEWPAGPPTGEGFYLTLTGDYVYIFSLFDFAVPDTMGGAIVAICDYLGPSYTPVNLYAKRVMGDNIPPNISLISPATGEVHYWRSGSVETISWAISDLPPTEAGLSDESVRVMYTTDEANFYSISSGDPSDSVPWTVPAGETTLGAIRIDASDRAGDINTNGSPNAATLEVLFQIDNMPPTVESTSPTGESLTYSEPIVIRFADASPMDTSAVWGAITISPLPTGIGITWEDGDRTLRIDHDPFLISTTYEVTIGTGARDLALNNLAAPYTWEFTSPAYTGDPLIDRVTFDGRKYFAASSYSAAYDTEIVSNNPRVGFRAYSGAGISDEGITIGVDIPGGTLYHVPSAYFAFTAGSTQEGFVSDFPITLSSGTHHIRIRVFNRDNREGVSNDIRVKVFGGKVELVPGTEILTYPSVLKPSHGETATISYVLTVSAKTSIYIYDTGGKVVLKKNFVPGVNGGRAGYNQFTWNGRTDFGRTAGNGIYVIKITSGNKLVGTGKIVVFE